LIHGRCYLPLRLPGRLAEGTQRALSQGSARAIAAADLGGTRGFGAVVEGYLTAQHRDHPETGCAAATSAEDVAPVASAARADYTRPVQEYLAAVLETVAAKADPSAARREAVLALSVLVGAISMARAVDDPSLFDQILAEAAGALTSLAAG
jgi:TetR/AcrR family transcriptional repressor of nem operon